MNERLEWIDIRGGINHTTANSTNHTPEPELILYIIDTNDTKANATGTITRTSKPNSGLGT